MESTPALSYKDALCKIEHYCAYQERCHHEVEAKLYTYKLTPEEIAEAIAHLISNNYLNEERFACLFAISKFHQKKWGKNRISQELKLRNISTYLVTKALREIPAHEYEEVFASLSRRFWDSITEKNNLKKRKKFCDYLLRKGWESEKVYEKVLALEKES